MFMILCVEDFGWALCIPCLKPQLERVRAEADSTAGAARHLKLSSLVAGD